MQTKSHTALGHWVRQHWALAQLLFFIVLTLVWLLPWIANGRIYLGDDLAFHLNRVQSITQYLKFGKLGLGHVATGSFNAWGYPINLFYPAYLLWPMAALQVLFGGPLAYTLYLFIINMATLYSASFVGQRLLHSRFQGIMVAVFYAFAHYRLLDFFVRGALAEGMTFAIIPLVFYGAYSIAAGDWHRWYWLAIGMALIALTHLVSLLLCAVLVLVTLGMALIKRQNLWWSFKMLCWAVITTVFLTVTCLAPLLQQLHRVGKLNVAQFSLEDSVQQPWAFLTDSMMNRMASGHINIGLVALILLLLGIVAFRRFSPRDRYLLVLGWLFTLMATRLFPWPPFQGLLGMIQFPWRFLGIANLFVALVGTRAIVTLFGQGWRFNRTAWLTAGTGIIVLFGFFSCQGFINSSAKTNRSIRNDQYHWAATTMRNPDYVPPRSLVSLDAIETHSIEVMDTRANGQRDRTIRQLSRTVGPDSFTYRVSSQRARQTKLPHLGYQGYQVWVNGQRRHWTADQTDVIHVAIPKGQSTIVLKYVPTGIQRLSAWISGLSWVSLIGWLIRKYRRGVTDSPTQSVTVAK